MAASCGASLATSSPAARRVRLVQVKALPSNLSFSAKTWSPIARTFCFADNLRQFPRAVTTFARCHPGVRTSVRKRRRETSVRPGSYTAAVVTTGRLLQTNKIPLGRCEIAADLLRIPPLARRCRRAHPRNPLRRAGCLRSKIPSAQGSCSALRGRNNTGTIIAL